MKAISLWQPWASLWCSPAKVHETRDKRWPIRNGWLAVHAAKRFETDVGLELFEVLVRTFGHGWYEMPTAVRVTGIHRTEDVVRCYGGWSPQVPEWRDDLACGNFAAGRWAIRRGEFRLLPQPVPWRGQRVLFDVPDEVMAPIFPPATARQYAAAEIAELARRGKEDPASLTSEERRAVCLYAAGGEGPCSTQA